MRRGWAGRKAYNYAPLEELINWEIGLGDLSRRHRKRTTCTCALPFVRTFVIINLNSKEKYGIRPRCISRTINKRCITLNFSFQDFFCCTAPSQALFQRGHEAIYIGFRRFAFNRLQFALIDSKFCRNVMQNPPPCMTIIGSPLPNAVLQKKRRHGELSCADEINQIVYEYDFVDTGATCVIYINV